MDILISPTQPVALFDTGAKTVNNASSWALVDTFLLQHDFREGLITLTVGSGGALGGLRITRAVVPGAPAVDWHVDGEFNVASQDFPSTQPLNIHQLPASASGTIKLGDLAGVGEISVYAKKASADTTLRVIGSFPVGE